MNPRGRRVDLGSWPLVGREDELALARDAVEAGGGVVLTGPPGVGKTRLAHEILASAAKGRRVEWIAATESTAQIPLGAAAHLLPPDAFHSQRDATLRAIVASLERESGHGGLLLGVDDAHLLDAASAALVHLLATTRTASVVVTTRSGERVPDSIVALWKDGPATVVALQALSRAEMDEVVTTVLEGPVDGALLHLLWESSGGNSLFVRELVRHGIESGALRQERASWRWHGQLDPDARLQDLVALRIGSVDDSESRALEVLAVGGQLPLSCLQVLDVTGQVERLAERGLVVANRQPVLGFELAHPLFGEVLRGRMPPSRVNRVRLDLANALEAAGNGDAERLRIALWRCDAGDHSRPAELCAAARRAWVLWTPVVAERLARAALESGPELEAAYLLGEALSDQGRPHDALEAFTLAKDLPGSDRIRAFAVINLASTLHYHLNRPSDARAHLQDALGAAVDEGIRHLIEGALAQLDATGGTVRSEAGSDVTAPSTHLARTLGYAASGRIDAALQTSTAALATSSQWQDEYPTVALMLQLAHQWVLVLAGRLAEVEHDAEMNYTRALIGRADYPRAGWCLVRGLASVAGGRARSAAALLGEGLDVLGNDDRGWLRPMHAYRSMAMALLGDHRAAAEHERIAESCNPSIEGVFGIDVRRARGWVRAARGELTAAVEECRSAAERARDQSQAALEMLALHDVARFGRPDMVGDRLSELSGVVDGALVSVLADHVIALRSRSGAALDAASGAFAQLGFDLFAAEASAAAAPAHREAGRRAAALASRDRAISIVSTRCDQVRTPTLDLLTVEPELTGREREVAQLAASGLASRTIAARLGISTRTVDNLLGRVYTKLAISSRAELVDLLGQ